MPTPTAARTETGTVLAVGANTVDVRMAGGEVYRHVPVSGGSPTVGYKIPVTFIDGKPVSAVSAAPSAGVGGLVVSGEGGGGGAGVYAPSPHALNSAHHSGEIATTQATWALQAAGDTITGNMTVSDGITIDGVDISAHAANASAHHNPVTVGNTGLSLSTQQVSLALAATSGLAISSGLMLADSVAGAGLTIASKVLAVGAGNGISVAADSVAVNVGYAFTWTALHTFNEGIAIAAGKKVTFGGDAVLSRKFADVIQVESGDYFESGSFTTGATGWQITGTGDAEFNNVKIRGSLHAAIFVKDLIEAHAGTLMVSKSSGKLSANMVVPTSGTWTMDIADPPGGGFLFDNDDICRCKSEWGGGVKDIWFTLSGRTAIAGGQQRYTCTWAYGDRSSEYTYVKGGPVVDYGVSGDGFISISADGAIGEAQNLSIATHAGSPWSTLTLQTRLGNLNGSYGQVSDVYGIGLGDYSSGNYLIYDGAALTVSTADGAATFSDDGVTVEANTGSIDELNAYKFSGGGQYYGLYAFRNTVYPNNSTNLSLMCYEVLDYQNTNIRFLSYAGGRAGAATMTFELLGTENSATPGNKTATLGLLSYYTTGSKIESDFDLFRHEGGVALGSATSAGAGEIISTYSTDAAVQWEINNANTGSSASAALQLTSDVATGRVAVFSDAAGERLNVTASGGYILFGTLTDQPIVFYQNNAEVARFSVDGGLNLGTATGAVTGELKASGGVTITDNNLYVSSTLASGTYSAELLAASGADRDILRAGVSGVSNGFFVTYTHSGTQMNYTFTGNNIRITSSKTPSSASDTGSAGQICWDTNYIYVAVGSNSWKRAALSSW